MNLVVVFFFQAEDGIRDVAVTGVQTCALPILPSRVGGRTVWLDRDGPWRDARPPPPRGRRDRPRPHGSPAGGLPRATIHLRGVVGTIEPVEHNPQAVQRPRVAGLE